MLIDASIPPQKIDLEFIDWMGSKGVPFVIVFTKTDKGTIASREKNIADFKSMMLEQWEELPTIFETSSNKKKGKEEILNFIEDLTK